MSCYHPLKGFPVGLTDNGKTKYKITSYDVDYVSINRETKSISCHQGVPILMPQYHHVLDYVQVPCGQCIGCRLDYSKDWANRMMLEASQYENNCFITLTYDDAHLPPRNDFIDEEGVIGQSPIHPLSKRDLQLFMKRLRKAFPDEKIRFYGCGEYGSQNMRPHYHIILFNFNFPDRVFLKKSSTGFNYYISETLQKLWKYGFSMCTDVSWDTCAYVSRYVTKKLKGKGSNIYDIYNFPPEFSLMSRKPGIARFFYDDKKEEIYANQEFFLSTKEGARKCKPPRYFDKLFDIDYPEDSAIIKDKRKRIAEVHNSLKTSLTSLSYQEMLISQEENVNARIKSLKRSL